MSSSIEVSSISINFAVDGPGVSMSALPCLNKIYTFVSPKEASFGTVSELHASLPSFLVLCLSSFSRKLSECEIKTECKRARVKYLYAQNNGFTQFNE